jgi:hypothetical protein
MPGPKQRSLTFDYFRTVQSLQGLTSASVEVKRPIHGEYTLEVYTD